MEERKSHYLYPFQYRRLLSDHVFALPIKQLKASSPRNTPFLLVSHAQGPDLEEVVVKIKYCKLCGKEAVTGDDWQEHGYMLFGNKLAVHLSFMDAARQAVHGGTAISQVFDNVLKPLADDIGWLERNRLASRYVQDLAGA